LGGFRPQPGDFEAHWQKAGQNLSPPIFFSEVAAMTCAVDDLAVELETDPLRRRRPEARPRFASRVKTPYNESFGGRGNKERLSISFPAESEAHASVALAELVQL
jgi:hypothetical protein